MKTIREAAEILLKALGDNDEGMIFNGAMLLRTVLDQPEQEPDEFCTATTEELMKELGCSDKKAKEIHDKVEALAQPEQEPFGYFRYDLEWDGWVETEPNNGKPLYTAPPKREWVGLTDEESIAMLQKAAKHKSPDYCTAPEMAVEFGRLASETLKEKNGGYETK